MYFFISSCAVLDTRAGGLLNEDSPKVLPIWQYSVEKWAAEQKLQKLGRGYPLPQLFFHLTDFIRS